jgi:ubiquinol-cytochrome c reductase cytochrome c1 subunit
MGTYAEVGGRKLMNKVIMVLLCLLAMNSAASESVYHRSVSVDIFDKKSVGRGAAYFANYCQGCHGVRQIRYSRIGKDLKLTEAEMRSSFMLGEAKIHDYVKTAMSADDAKITFGVAPPDLSLVVRARGADWIFSYLKSFYTDPKRPFGVNNVVLPNVAMPNVLWEFQGTQEPVFKDIDGVPTVIDVKSTASGKLSEEQFDEMLTDLVNYLAYVSEPSKLDRIPMGKWVILFLVLITALFFKLKKEYWKDIGQN